MSENYCPHCMKPAAGARCPHCGGDLNWRGQKGIDLPVGTVLTGGNGLRTYQIGAARGKGGFGITYVALELNSGRRMAVKEYFPTRCAFRGGNEVDVQRMTGQEDVFQSGMNSFLDEGRMLLSQDDLTCVVHVIDYFQANGTAYLVMEYLDGVALHAQMTRMGGRIPVSELMPRLAPLLRDIGQLHQRGVIHRDISPDNIMWMPDGSLKLLDFGSARSMEGGKSMTVLMKQGFSPIEQYRSKGQGPYTDVYALAATIYYCVTGVIPPAAAERLDEDTLQSPSALGAALTVDQETALLWALSVQPKARPQSMEEFASRLYQEAPVPGPQSPFQTESAYVNPPPAQPVTGQNTSYPYNYGGQTTGQYGGQYGSQPAGQHGGQPVGQYGGQPVGQYGGQPVGQYGGQPAGQYGGQPAGQYGGQPVGQYVGQTAGQGLQGQPGGWTGGNGGRKKTPIFIGAGAAVALIAIIAVAVLNRGGTADTPTYTAPPISHAPVHTETPTPSPTVPPTPEIDIVTGVTDDGFLYQIVDRSYAVLTGCEAEAGFSYMPDDVDGVPITEIAEGAFAGAVTGGFVNLPLDLETIGADAFRGCADLSYVYAYGNVVCDSSSFSGCSDMWFVAVHNSVSTSGWQLPKGVRLYYYGMETEVGALNDINKSGNILTGETEDGYTVLLDVKPWTDPVTGLDSVDWIFPGALRNLSYSTVIELGEGTTFPFEYYGAANWIAPEGSLADMWVLTCRAAESINDARPSGAREMRPDRVLVDAAIIRAEELLTEYAHERPNGGDSWTLLDDLGVSRSLSQSTRGRNSSDPNRMVEYVTENYSAALTQEQTANHAGEYTDRMGMAWIKQSDGQYTWFFYTVLS